MTNRNDLGNWIVLVASAREAHDEIIHMDQAENKARAAADKYAAANPGVTVSLYQRVGVVTGTITTKWE